MQGSVSASFSNLSTGVHILLLVCHQYTDGICLKPRTALPKRVQKSETFRNYTEYRKLIKLLNMVILEAKWGKKKQYQEGRISFKCCWQVKKWPLDLAMWKSLRIYLIKTSFSLEKWGIIRLNCLQLCLNGDRVLPCSPDLRQSSCLSYFSQFMKVF